MTAILQGIADDTAYRRVQRYLSPLIMLPMPETVFIWAAAIYRKLRKTGITVRKSNDCIIAIDGMFSASGNFQVRRTDVTAETIVPAMLDAD